MAIKETSYETAVTDDGREIVSEINTVITETAPDGTETVAEITTTASEDDPTEIEGHITLTETAPDGTETVTEITTAPDGTVTIDEQGSFAEEVIEALFDGGAGAEIPDENTDEYTVYEATEETSEFDAGAADFTVGEEMFAPGVAPVDASEASFAETPLDYAVGFAETPFAASPDAAPAFDSIFENPLNETDAAELAVQEHAQAAKDAQSSADEFIAAGDYAAAADAREVAENEAWEAGDDTMLGAYDAQDLTVAAEKQDEAESFSEQQAEYARAGDYEAAREAASQAEYATSDADWRAGGDDHSGQAAAEYYNMDNAVWQEGLRDDDLDNAAYHAELGNYDSAESSLDSAAAHQASADHFGDLGEHGGEMAVFDPSSVVETGGSYDSSYDTSSVAVDTGFDSSMDTSIDTSVDTTDV